MDVQTTTGKASLCDCYELYHVEVENIIIQLINVFPICLRKIVPEQTYASYGKMIPDLSDIAPKTEPRSTCERMRLVASECFCLTVTSSFSLSILHFSLFLR